VHISRISGLRLAAATILVGAAGTSSPSPLPLGGGAALPALRVAAPLGQCRGSGPADLNGDGTAEVAVGAPYTTIAGQDRAGAVAIYASGKVTWLSQHTGPDAAERGDGFGAALAVGDFDGDRCGDLAVGVPDEAFGERRGGADGHGAVQVYSGSPAGPRPTRLLTMRTLGASLGSDRFGAALVAANLDGDREDELVVGAPGRAGGGAVAIFGLRGLTHSSGMLVSQRTGWVGQPGMDTDEFGGVLAAGDFDGDGRAEVAVGAPGDGTDSAGTVTILDPLERDATYLVQGGAGIAGEPERLDRFGAALAAGDFDHDGKDDLAVGVPGEDPGGGRTPRAFSAGAVQVLHGPYLRQHGRAWTQHGRFDRFGSALAAGDLNGDRVADLAVGAPGQGAVRILRGARGSGLTARRGVRISPPAGGQFGWALLVRDGRLLVSAPGMNSFGGTVSLVAGRSLRGSLELPAGGLLGYALG
jgi:FG-GAP repeat protein